VRARSRRTPREVRPARHARQLGRHRHRGPRRGSAGQALRPPGRRQPARFVPRHAGGHSAAARVARLDRQPRVDCRHPADARPRDLGRDEGGSHLADALVERGARRRRSARDRDLPRVRGHADGRVVRHRLRRDDPARGLRRDCPHAPAPEPARARPTGRDRARRLLERRRADQRRLMALADFPREPLLFGPSPVPRLDRLTEHLGGQVEIWAKREDCNSGLAYGGNKVRKLEYLAADALAQGCDTLVSIGGVQSNHTRQVAAVAAHLGLACVLVQEHWVDWDDRGYEHVGNILLSRIMGADVRLSEAGFDIGFRPAWEQAPAEVEARGGKPYAVPAGASDHPLGGLGFARWAVEVADQERELGVFFDTIVVCSVTGSTQAGMVAGFAAQERADRVIGIDITAKPQTTRTYVRRIAEQTADLVGLGRAITDADIVLDERYAHPAYGVPAEVTLDAIRLCARLEGMLTDPVYEGKSMQAMIDMVGSGRFPAGAKLL